MSSNRNFKTEYAKHKKDGNLEMLRSFFCVDIKQFADRPEQRLQLARMILISHEMYEFFVRETCFEDWVELVNGWHKQGLITNCQWGDMADPSMYDTYRRGALDKEMTHLVILAKAGFQYSTSDTRKGGKRICWNLTLPETRTASPERRIDLEPTSDAFGWSTNQWESGIWVDFYRAQAIKRLVTSEYAKVTAIIVGSPRDNALEVYEDLMSDDRYKHERALSQIRVDFRYNTHYFGGKLIPAYASDEIGDAIFAELIDPINGDLQIAYAFKELVEAIQDNYTFSVQVQQMFDQLSDSSVISLGDYRVVLDRGVADDIAKVGTSLRQKFVYQVYKELERGKNQSLQDRVNNIFKNFLDDYELYAYRMGKLDKELQPLAYTENQRKANDAVDHMYSLANVFPHWANAISYAAMNKIPLQEAFKTLPEESWADNNRKSTVLVMPVRQVSG